MSLFSRLLEHPQIIQRILDHCSNYKHLLFLCRQIHPHILKKLQEQWYCTKATTRIAREPLVRLKKQQHSDWAKICLFALACLHSCEWGIGAPRLFFLDSDNDSILLDQAMEKHPNPKDVQWETVLQCTLDKVDMYHALSGSTDQPRLFHYSETMDAGVFFIFLNLESIGKVLLRVKPIGTQEQICSTGNGNVIIWDEIMYGFCSHCNQCLPRVQVCADCKVEQYCKRKCQRQHWDEGHKEECKQLWFYVKQPDEEQERYASAFIQDVIDRKRKHVQDLAEAPAVDQLQWMDAAQQDPSFNWQPDRENELPDEHDLSKNDDRSPKKIRVIEN